MELLVLALNLTVSLIGLIGIVGLMGIAVYQFLETFKQGTNQLMRMHSIPCSRCAYFTGDYRLKCTVNPVSALTEEAIGCVDYESAQASSRPCSMSRSATSRVAKDLLNLSSG